MTNNKQLKEIANEILNREYNYEYVGVRVEEEINNEIGQIAGHTSSVWIDNVEQEEKLNGVCAINVRRADELSNSTYCGYLGNIIVVLGSERAECGEDDGEIIMEEPIILDIITVEEE